jgi:hypothetical protein
MKGVLQMERWLVSENRAAQRGAYASKIVRMEIMVAGSRGRWPLPL